MTVRMMGALLFLALATGGATADPLARSGQWEALRTDIRFAGSAGASFLFREVCTARTGNDRAYFSVSVLPDGLTLVQIAADVWDWRDQRRDAKVVLGHGTVELIEAFYTGDHINHGIPADRGGVAPMRLLSRETGLIHVYDDRDRLLARFPSEGFAAMLERAIRCAG